MYQHDSVVTATKCLPHNHSLWTTVLINKTMMADVFKIGFINVLQENTGHGSTIDDVIFGVVFQIDVLRLLLSISSQTSLSVLCLVWFAWSVLCCLTDLVHSRFNMLHDQPWTVHKQSVDSVKCYRLSYKISMNMYFNDILCKAI